MYKSRVQLIAVVALLASLAYETPVSVAKGLHGDVQPLVVKPPPTTKSTFVGLSGDDDVKPVAGVEVSAMPAEKPAKRSKPPKASLLAFHPCVDHNRVKKTCVLLVHVTEPPKPPEEQGKDQWGMPGGKGEEEYDQKNGEWLMHLTAAREAFEETNRALHVRDVESVRDNYILLKDMSWDYIALMVELTSEKLETIAERMRTNPIIETKGSKNGAKLNETKKELDETDGIAVFYLEDVETAAWEVGNDEAFEVPLQFGFTFDRYERSAPLVRLASGAPVKIQAKIGNSLRALGFVNAGTGGKRKYWDMIDKVTKANNVVVVPTAPSLLAFYPCLGSDGVGKTCTLLVRVPKTEKTGQIVNAHWRFPGGRTEWRTDRKDSGWQMDLTAARLLFQDTHQTMRVVDIGPMHDHLVVQPTGGTWDYVALMQELTRAELKVVAEHIRTNSIEGKSGVEQTDGIAIVHLEDLEDAAYGNFGDEAFSSVPLQFGYIVDPNERNAQLVHLKMGTKVTVQAKIGNSLRELGFKRSEEPQYGHLIDEVKEMNKVVVVPAIPAPAA